MASGFLVSARLLIGCGIWYAVRALTGYEVGLIAIIVGLLVGGAVRKGSKRRGGRLYQTLAVLLTYASIVSTYVPDIVGELKKLEGPEASQVSSPTPTGRPQPSSAPGPPTSPEDTRANSASSLAARRVRTQLRRYARLPGRSGRLRPSPRFCRTVSGRLPEHHWHPDHRLCALRSLEDQPPDPLEISGPYRIANAAVEPAYV